VDGDGDDMQRYWPWATLTQETTDMTFGFLIMGAIKVPGGRRSTYASQDLDIKTITLHNITCVSYHDDSTANMDS